MWFVPSEVHLSTFSPSAFSSTISAPTSSFPYTSRLEISTVIGLFSAVISITSPSSAMLTAYSLSLRIYPLGLSISRTIYCPKGTSVNSKQPFSSEAAVIIAVSLLNFTQSAVNSPNTAFSRGSLLSSVLCPSILPRLRRFTNCPQSISTFWISCPIYSKFTRYFSPLRT